MSKLSVLLVILNISGYNWPAQAFSDQDMDDTICASDHDCDEKYTLIDYKKVYNEPTLQIPDETDALELLQEDVFNNQDNTHHTKSHRRRKSLLKKPQVRTRHKFSRISLQKPSASHQASLDMLSERLEELRDLAERKINQILYTNGTVLNLLDSLEKITGLILHYNYCKIV